MVLPFCDAVEGMVDLCELATSLCIEAVKHCVILFLDNCLFAILVERGAIAAYVPLDATHATQQILP